MRTFVGTRETPPAASRWAEQLGDDCPEDRALPLIHRLTEGGDPRETSQILAQLCAMVGGGAVPENLPQRIREWYPKRRGFGDDLALRVQAAVVGTRSASNRARFEALFS